MTETTTESAFRWRSVLVVALLPTVLFSIGEGAILPIIPVVAQDLGAQLALAGLIAAMITLGTLLGDLPSGAIVALIGERRAMMGAAVLAAAGGGIALLARSPFVLGIGILAIGIATAVFALARHAFMTSFVPIRYRARALSTLGGTFRFGYLIGPFLTAAIIHLTGIAAAAFWIHLGCCLAVLVLLLVTRDPSETVAAARREHRIRAGGPVETGAVELAPEGLFATLRRYRRVLLSLGLGSMLVAALRASRQVILPLWAVSIGMHEADAAILIGVAGAVDFALFYVGGQIMDRFGRLWTAVPSMIGLGLGHLGLALSAPFGSPVWWFTAAAMLLAVSNGIGSGILMTLGADLADPARPAAFLGAWRFCNDSGGAAAPLLVSGITALAGLPLAAAVMGVLGLVGAGVLRVFVPRYSTRR
ncbi:MFS transporter [Schumannella sp. 10F1B-5-1]|uniref:MFS transporter n=1 Tax=Schumannella sp. 10F1B-5-1 TaxID=2590780 RepID=UPI0011301E42|nr:MFS transporter [Schumannella sp. 10F1B-5-1]TPW73354.1 MFS transporter [Schumannella sp. 10F1B-5-1]